MITIGPELSEALTSYSVTAVAFIDLEFSDGEGFLHDTEAPRPITIDGQIYRSSPNLQGISAPETQNAIDRDNYSLIFADNDGGIKSRITASGVHGIPLTVRLGFIDDDGNLITELLNVYKGQSSSFRWAPINEGYQAQIGFTGQLTQLDSTRSLMTTPESQKQLDPVDESMNQVHSTTNDSALKWGRKV